MIIKTTDPVKQKKAKKSTYKLTVEIMHGDADLEESEVYHYTESQLDQLYQIITIFDYLKKFYCNDYDKKIKELKSPLVTEDQDTLYDLLLNYIGGNKMCDGQGWASVEGYTVTYFDEHGVEWHTDIDKD